ncbi:MAG TPA: EAL domain-containing protein [Candidatus Limnocylindria bacterium]
MRKLRRHAAFLALAASVGAFTLAFDPLYQVAGPAAGVLILGPVLVAAWSFRLPVVLVTSVVVATIQTSKYALEGELGGKDMRTTILTAVAVALVGWLLSYARGAHRSITRLIATDAATGLLNRASFVKILEAGLKIDGRAGSDLVIVDIIHFRQITETFGHETGDELLRAIGQRLRSYSNTDDRVARIGPDKFLLWLPASTTALASAQATLALVTAPLKIAGTEVRLEARVAVARYPDHASTAVELVRRVEIALDEGKAKGRSMVVATARSEQERLSRLETFDGLRAAIANGELRLHYQPIVELPSTAVRSVEALVRWQHPERGLLAPGEFIPVAEQSGLIVPLTQWVLTEALRQSRLWSDEGRPIRIAVNVGAKALAKSASLPALLSSLLRASGVDPALLALEVTESEVMADAEQAIACLRDLKALGVFIEVDDFGTGYSSLAYLQKLPLDAVKIDRSFITPLFDDAGTSAIVRAAIELSHALGLETIAEGVEDQPVVEMLSAMGCDAAQGYVFARPMTADKLSVWLAAHAKVEKAVSPTPPSALPSQMNGGTVLVVDDEHPFRLSAHRILTAQGYKVLHAATASEALRLCAAHHGEIDLVLTDLFLSDWQGHKLAAHLRSMYPDLHVMFMSGDPSGIQLAGANTFLAKPFSRQQLVSGVSVAMAS